MALTKFYTDVDFRKNNLRSILLDPVTTFPSGPKNGQIVFRQDQGVFYWWNASVSVWIPLGNTTVIAEAGSGLTAIPQSDGSYKISFNPDTAFLSVNSTTNTVGIVAAAIGTTELKDVAVTTIKVAAKAITFAKIQDISTMVLIGRTAAGSGSAGEVPILNENDMHSNSPSGIPTQSAVKAYVDSMLGSFGGYVGSYDAMAAGGNFPQLLGGNLKGSFWDIITPGDLQGIKVSPGDVIMSKKLNASPTNVTDWIVFQGNLEHATESYIGYARIATQFEVNLGADDTTIVTPKKLKATLVNGTRYTTNLGDGITQVFTVTHNLVAPLLDVQFYTSTGEQVYTGWIILDLNTIQVTFTTAPIATSPITIIVKPN